ALGEAVGLRLCGDVALAEEAVGDRVEIADRALEVALDALWKVPGLAFDLALLLDAERELHARQEHGLGAHQRGQVRGDDLGRIEIARIRPEAHARAGLAWPGLADLPKGLLDLAVVAEDDAVHAAVAAHLDLETP